VSRVGEEQQDQNATRTDKWWVECVVSYDGRQCGPGVSDVPCWVIACLVHAVSSLKVPIVKAEWTLGMPAVGVAWCYLSGLTRSLSNDVVCRYVRKVKPDYIRYPERPGCASSWINQLPSGSAVFPSAVN
jgi:hypothetical protein